MPTDSSTSTIDSTLDDDLRGFQELLSLFPGIDPLDLQPSTSTPQPTNSTTTAPTTTTASTRSFTVPLPNTTSAVPIATISKPPHLKISPPHFKMPLVSSNSRNEKRTQIVRP